MTKTGAAFAQAVAEDMAKLLEAANLRLTDVSVEWSQIQDATFQNDHVELHAGWSLMHGGEMDLYVVFRNPPSQMTDITLYELELIYGEPEGPYSHTMDIDQEFHAYFQRSAAFLESRCMALLNGDPQEIARIEPIRSRQNEEYTAQFTGGKRPASRERTEYGGIVEQFVGWVFAHPPFSRRSMRKRSDDEAR